MVFSVQYNIAYNCLAQPWSYIGFSIGLMVADELADMPTCRKYSHLADESSQSRGKLLKQVLV